MWCVYVRALLEARSDNHNNRESSGEDSALARWPSDHSVSSMRMRHLDYFILYLILSFKKHS